MAAKLAQMKAEREKQDAAWSFVKEEAKPSSTPR
jgi:hypothetical protein